MMGESTASRNASGGGDGISCEYQVKILLVEAAVAVIIEESDRLPVSS